MWCKNCNIETNEKNCPVCGEETVEDTPTEVYWCKECHIPVMQEVSQPDKGICPRCGKQMKYLARDIRPVFPEERLLLELLLDKEPYKWAEKSVWAENNRYYIDGKAISLPNRLFKETNTDGYIEQLQRYEKDNPHKYFEEYIVAFVNANRMRLDYLIDEAHRFITKAAEKFPEENIVLSFSGGKDSTVTADLAIKALSDPSLVHIFGNTTLEFPLTIEYARRYRENHPQAIFKVAKNYEQDFHKVCEDIGPPARMMRWCCSMFKTGPITRVINGLYRNQRILTFYGIRKSESVSRSKYNRIEDDAESVKIQQQTVASPIFFWKDMDIWLYILSEDIDFNDAYRLGYDRVGCWCCPNNNQRAQFLSRIYMPEESKLWREFLIDFAKKVGKPDPEEYVDSGAWKARQGGNGLAAAGDVKIRFTNCTTEDHAKIYRLVRPMDDEFLNMLTPFGRVAPELGQKLLHEVLVLDLGTNVPILSVQPFEQDGYEHAVKVRTMNVKDHDSLQHMVGYQVRKFNACRKCLKCESLCQAGAISISEDGYHIDPDKCVHCKMCVTAKYLRGGCMMDKYLRTKD
ncbi:phosphoadenosine phosphosulfate reductase family protein [Eubacterium pyruvativorans]|uniref:phosphoadenosine phosphosulfate reductase domain-containing protein n=1 Tax=Eubacterium pyruvativorans TaxID=155865 RepID=UPI0008871E8C|nr:phosphoadenosine phosphosulfate reductase family protein [Eubacterium pyruvativorans]SDF48763.1 phosphoadenosine phosphosulfate reductase [Eubacterium pyruvativorans]